MTTDLIALVQQGSNALRIMNRFKAHGKLLTHQCIFVQNLWQCRTL